MYNNYDYPLGADNSDAPWNVIVNPEESFEVTISQTLSKKTNVFTDEYNYERYGDEVILNTDDIDWKEVYNDQFHTPLELINILKEYLTLDLEKSISSRNKKAIKYLLEECEDWINDETEVIKD